MTCELLHLVNPRFSRYYQLGTQLRPDGRPIHTTMSTCPPYAPFFGFAGVASAVSSLSNVPYSSCRSTALSHRWCSAVSFPSTHSHFSFGADYNTPRDIVSCRGGVWYHEGRDWDFRTRNLQAGVDHEGRGGRNRGTHRY